MEKMIRSILACIIAGREEPQGYTQLIFDEKLAQYADYQLPASPELICHEKMAPYTDEPEESYTQPEPMTYDVASVPSLATEDARTVEEVAREITRLLWQAEWNDSALQTHISNELRGRCWTRKMAEECLDNVIEYVEQGRAHMGDAMCETLDRVVDIADEEFAFPRGHPPSLDGFISIVSAGVLADMLGAWVLELLGFGEVRGKTAPSADAGWVSMLTSDKITLSETPKNNSYAAYWMTEYAAYIPPDSVVKYWSRLDMVKSED
ncbi:hypothetical protein N656DRAFT_616446 [Canariomyces notabilis]|uniref:Uncharacterized protein n=1 Tax=Canariomyces notabilis TaxID=2074819 RepID=A0AAN6YTW1_9PEZI|nr:hypothetical protein N656DRAFT_616446 [Canariomyces arenarius]